MFPEARPSYNETIRQAAHENPGRESATARSRDKLHVLIAGGGFKHGQHLAFDTQNNHNLATLYVSMLQSLSIESDTFASAKRTMEGLEKV